MTNKLSSKSSTSEHTLKRLNKNSNAVAFSTKDSDIDNGISDFRQKYIHVTATDEEAHRLHNQASGAEKFLWKGIDLTVLIKSKDHPFLEVGCGVGAQSTSILSRLPENINLVGIDIDAEQVKRADNFMKQNGIFSAHRYKYEVCDITQEDLVLGNTFSGAYICWVLEHMTFDQSIKALRNIFKALEPGAPLIINEIIMEPDTGVRMQHPSHPSLLPPYTKKYLIAMNDLQKEEGGNPNFGIQDTMIRALNEAGFTRVSYESRCMSHNEESLTDKSRMEAIELFNSALPKLIHKGLVTNQDFTKVVDEISEVTEFYWNFGQAIAFKDDDKDSHIGIVGEDTSCDTHL